MKCGLIVAALLISAGLYAESHGDIGVSTLTYVPYSLPYVYPTEVEARGSFSVYTYPSDALSFFLDIEAAGGVSLAGGEVDRWYSESSLAADGSLRFGEILCLIGTDVYAYVDTAGYSYTSFEPFVAVNGGNPKVGWSARVSGPVLFSDTVSATLEARAGLSIAAGSSLIVDPALIFVSPNVPGGSLRVTWFGGIPATVDAEVSYFFYPDDIAPHILSWDPTVSLFWNVLGGTDFSLELPGSIQFPSESAPSLLILSPAVTAGVPLGDSVRVLLSFASEFATDEEAFGSVDLSLIYSF